MAFVRPSVDLAVGELVEVFKDAVSVGASRTR